MGSRTYSDDALVAAIAGARSWRGVLRLLGLSATSAAAIRSVRARAQLLGLDYAHFTGQRRWTDHQLTAAVAAAHSWGEVAEALGLSYGASTTILRGRATRLGLDTSHFTAERQTVPDATLKPDLAALPRAGSLLAAAWFTLCGCDVSWPLEPCRYDLMVRGGDTFRRVQVKTTRLRSADSWRVSLTTGGRQPEPYDPGDIDDFFVIDGDGNYYLIPVHAVGGRHAITLLRYTRFRLEQLPAQPA